MKKLISVLLLTAVTNSYAEVSGNIQYPDYIVYVKQSRPISSTFEYTLHNTTIFTQTYHIHCDIIIPPKINASIDKDVLVNSNSTVHDFITVEKSVLINVPGNYKATNSMTITGESNWSNHVDGKISAAW